MKKAFLAAAILVGTAITGSTAVAAAQSGTPANFRVGPPQVTPKHPIGVFSADLCGAPSLAQETVLLLGPADVTIPHAYYRSAGRGFSIIWKLPAHLPPGVYKVVAHSQPKRCQAFITVRPPAG